MATKNFLSLYWDLMRQGKRDLASVLSQTEAGRLQMAELALYTTPHFINLKLELNRLPMAPGQVVTLTSDTEKDDVLVIGSATNLPPNACKVRLIKQGSYKMTSKSAHYLDVYTQPDPSDIAIINPVFWQTAQRLNAGDYYELDIKNVSGAAINVPAFFTLICLRQLPFAADAQRSEKLRKDKLLEAIRRNPDPFDVFINLPVIFAGNSAEDLESEKQDRLLLVWGAISRMRFATFELTDPRGFNLSKTATPIWALAANPKSARALWRFPFPLLLAADDQFKGKVMTGSLSDMYRPDGTQVAETDNDIILCARTL